MNTDTSIESLSLTNPDTSKLDIIQKISLAFVAIGLLLLLMAFTGFRLQPTAFLPLSLLLILIGTLVYAQRTYSKLPIGIHNNGIWFSSLSGRGIAAWILGIFLTGFYVALYWFPEYLGLGLNGKPNSGLIGFFDPFSTMLGGKQASQWFVYGTLYTLAILVLGYKFILKYRHNRYQKIRTLVVMASQLFFAYLIPEIMEALNSDKPYSTKTLKICGPSTTIFLMAGTWTICKKADH
jgi:hypothetical protein